MKQRLLLISIVGLSGNMLAQGAVEQLDNVVYEDYVGGQWANDDKTEFEYDFKGNLTTETSYGWNGSGWDEDYKEQHTYDGANRVTETIEYIWDAGNNDWLEYYKETFAYDANGRLSEELRYSWLISQWQESYKEEYTYGTNGKVSLRMEYTWGGTQWTNSRKSEYTYNTAGKLTENTAYYWDGSAWAEQENYQYEYDANGNMTTFYYYWWNGQWEGDYKEEYSYNANGKISESIGYSWDTGINDWGDASEKNEYSYDVNGNVIDMTWSWWDDVNSEWILEEKLELDFDLSIEFSDLYFGEDDFGDEFDFVNKPVSWVYSEFTGSTWVANDRATYNYSEVTGIKQPHSTFSLGVYPNPASDFIVFDLDDAQKPANLSLFNAKGEKVVSQQVSSRKRVSVNHLSPGLYIYDCVYDGMHHSGKIVLE